jgi:iron complex transport system permease protein
MDRRIILAILVAAIAVFPLQFLSDEASAAEGDVYGGDFLVDYGNGRTTWIALEKGEDLSSTIASSLKAASIQYSENLKTIDGMSGVTIGTESTGGSLSLPGATGVKQTSGWNFYIWSGSEWVKSDLSSSYDGSPVAVGFYPEDLIPVETPDRKSSWTAIEGDSWNSANQTTEYKTDKSGRSWEVMPKFGGPDPAGLYGGVLVTRDMVIAKFGAASGTTGNAGVKAFDIETGGEIWSFEFYAKMMDTTSACVMGQYVYVGSNNGHIYKFDWREGPGDNYCNVTTIGGAPYDDEKAVIPEKTIDIDWYVSYTSIITSMVADSGSIYVKGYNGMCYCFDSDLNLVWSYQMGGHTYYSTPTVFDGYVFAGCYDGTLYIIDQATGELITSQIVYQTEDFKGKCGSANVSQVYKDADKLYTIFITCSDGLGMDSKYSSLVIYTFNAKEKITKLVKDFKTTLGNTGSYSTRYETDDFKGIIIGFYKGLYKVDENGNATLLTDFISGYHSLHSTPVLVNGEILYMTTYGSKSTVSYDLSTGRIGLNSGVSNYAMVGPAVIDGLVLVPDDTGLQTFYANYPEYVPPTPVPTDDGLWKIIMYVLIGLVIFLIALWIVLRFALKWEHPFSDLRAHIMHFFFGAEYTHNKKSKRKVRAVVLFGVVITVAISLVSLCVGSETTMSIGDAVNAAISAISKGGHNLTYEEMLIYNQRLPRVLAAIGVGIGLSVAGAMYQAVIKNPLVEPYIMGVSSGAGTFAVAVLTFNFTFFGLFAANSIYLTAFSAIFGGLLAFGLTMLLAMKTGGKSINYVLAGIVIGLVFSAVQSLLMIGAGTKVSSALSWLYGSFSTMTWDKVWLVLIPAMFLSMIPLIWAKEFNLILLGEDQAKQMGLNAKRFDAVMLIIASVLTSFCVAFCGVIGFVGLVIPHLSRMILGGDHRLMLPATMAFGGFLMVAADLLSRVLLSGYELPVGAITTAIGVPVFAYLLIKRGRSYDV